MSVVELAQKLLADYATIAAAVPVWTPAKVQQLLSSLHQDLIAALARLPTAELEESELPGPAPLELALLGELRSRTKVQLALAKLLQREAQRPW